MRSARATKPQRFISDLLCSGQFQLRFRLWGALARLDVWRPRWTKHPCAQVSVHDRVLSSPPGSREPGAFGAGTGAPSDASQSGLCTTFKSCDPLPFTKYSWVGLARRLRRRRRLAVLGGLHAFDRTYARARSDRSRPPWNMICLSSSSPAPSAPAHKLYLLVVPVSDVRCQLPLWLGAFGADARYWSSHAYVALRHDVCCLSSPAPAAPAWTSCAAMKRVRRLRRRATNASFDTH